MWAKVLFHREVLVKLGCQPNFHLDQEPSNLCHGLSGHFSVGVSQGLVMKTFGQKKSLNINQMMSFGNLGHSVALLPPDEDKDWFPEEVSVQQVIL